MILGRPWALALLAVPPILIWLRLRAARPRLSEASSLLVWSRVSPEGAPAARPRPPKAAWLEAAGAALLALGLADFAVAGPEVSKVRVLTDRSPSVPWEEINGPGHFVRHWKIKDAIDASGVAVELEETRDLEGRLPGALAAGGPLVVVTDRRLASFPDDPPRLQVVGIGRRGFNAGITAAFGAPIDDRRWRLFLTIEAFGAPGPVEGALHLEEAKERITLTAGTPLEIAREVPIPSDQFVSARVEFAGDVLDSDNDVEVERGGGIPVRVVPKDPLRDSPLVRALVASGAERIDPRNDMPREGDAGNWIRVVPTKGPEIRILLPDEADGPQVSGAEVTTGDHPLYVDLRIDPSVTLGRRGKAPPAGDVLLADASGPLATLEGRDGVLYLHLGFTPGGSWAERDPSFVVFAKNIVDILSGGPARLDATGVLDPEETRQAAEGETFGDLRAALEAARRPDPATRHSLASILLLAGAGLLAAAWVAAR